MLAEKMALANAAKRKGKQKVDNMESGVVPEARSPTRCKTGALTIHEKSQGKKRAYDDSYLEEDDADPRRLRPLLRGGSSQQNDINVIIGTESNKDESEGKKEDVEDGRGSGKAARDEQDHDDDGDVFDYSGLPAEDDNSEQEADIHTRGQDRPPQHQQEPIQETLEDALYRWNKIAKLANDDALFAQQLQEQFVSSGIYAASM